MKLRTSFFNLGVLSKNLTRFAPLWILYAIGEVLGLMTLNLGEAAFRLADDLSYVIGPVGFFHAVYALIVAVCLFGDLFDSRLCNGLHAMPMRREGWLLTNLLSGLIFALIPAIVGGGFAAIILREYWWVAIVWQLCSLLQFLFFFGVAVFSAMCAGKKLAMIAIFAILNFLSQLIYWVATMIYEPLLPGVTLSSDWYDLFCPMTTIAGHSYFELNISYANNTATATFGGYHPEAWYYLFICAGVGVVFLFLSWLLYRKRHLETAGDFISFRPMRIFFLLAYTFAVGALVYGFSDIFGTYRDYGFLAVGILIGWFTGWMLLERTVKIFSKKAIAGFAVFAVLFAGSIGLTAADPAGIVTYVPQTEEIAKVTLHPLSAAYYNSSIYDSGWYISDPAEVAEVQMFHKQILETPEDPDSNTIHMELQYVLKNGRQVNRSYNVPVNSTVAKELKLFLSDPRAVFAVNDWQQVKDTVRMAQIYINDVKGSGIDLSEPEKLQGLLAAIEADCNAGSFAQNDYFHDGQPYIGGIQLAWDVTPLSSRAPNTRYEYVTVYGDCVNTGAFLKTLGIA